jgi:hypothetical protein
MTASSIEIPPYHRAGRASIEATGTVQGRSVRAPQTTIATAIGPRIQSGTGSDAHVPVRPEPRFAVTTPIHSLHSPGARANDAATMAVVAPNAIASDRHSRRTANHSRPIPGVIFVRRTIDQVHGQRNPRTIAPARSRETFPPATSIAVNGKSSAARSRRGPARNRTALRSSAVQAAMNACHGRAGSGETSWRNAGE